MYFISYEKVYFSTRFFTDITHNRASNEVIYRFSSEKQLKKPMICIQNNKNDNHWFIIVIFPLTKIIVSVGSFNQCNNAEIETIFNYT